MWTVYLSGEIHSDWRRDIELALENADLPVTLTSPVLDHSRSDQCGVDILGDEEKTFWKDHKGAGINAIRTQNLIKQADCIVVRFGDQYRQWNAAFEAGLAVAWGKPLIVMHDDSLTHALKEVDAAAQAVCSHPRQVAEILKYVITA